jgi:hypothetical protein
MSRRRSLSFAAICLCLLARPTAAPAQVVRTQSFDTNPGWATVGSGVNGNSFGYLVTGRAGGTAGEGGGQYTRSTTTRYYGDTNLGGALTLNQPFSAGGKFNPTAFSAPDIGTGLVLGHFAVGGVGQVGIVFNNDASNLYWRAYVRFNDGTDVNTLANVIGANVARTWDYTWNPAGGAQGGGLLTVDVSGPGGGTQTIDLNPAQRALGSTVDAFGLSSRPAVSSNSGQFVDLAIDDLSYTAVPEPSALVLVGVAALAGWRALRSRAVAPLAP